MNDIVGCNAGFNEIIHIIVPTSEALPTKEEEYILSFLLTFIYLTCNV